MSERHRAHVWVSGRVQGVWFRESCREQANAAGVSGWVRNLSDGRVEAVFEGPAPAVDRVVNWCRSGPSAGEVTDVELLVEAAVGESGFRVR